LSGFIATGFGFDRLGEDFADCVKYASVGDGIRSRGVLILTARSISSIDRMPQYLSSEGNSC
jgi:hypothetical protein